MREEPENCLPIDIRPITCILTEDFSVFVSVDSVDTYRILLKNLTEYLKILKHIEIL